MNGRSATRSWLERLALVEATTYLVLVAAAIWRSGFGGPNLSPVFGPVHGVIVLVYFWLAWQVAQAERWDTNRRLGVFCLAIVPFGGFYVRRNLL